MDSNVNIAKRTHQTAVENESTHINNNGTNSNNNNSYENSNFAFSFAKKFNNSIPPISFISPPLLNQKQNEFNFPSRQSLLATDRIPLPPLQRTSKPSKPESLDSETTEMSSSDSSLSSFGLATAQPNENLLHRHQNIRTNSSCSSDSSSSSASSTHSTSLKSKIDTFTKPSHFQAPHYTAKFNQTQKSFSTKEQSTTENCESQAQKITADDSNIKLSPPLPTQRQGFIEDVNEDNSAFCDRLGIDYEGIKETLNNFSRQVDFKMKGLVADDETKNQINGWMTDKSNVPVNIQFISNNNNKKNILKINNNNNSNSRSYYRTFNDWRSHLIFYKQTKGYHRNTPEEMSFRNLKNSMKNSKSNENQPNTTTTTTNTNDLEQHQYLNHGKLHYPLAVLNTNFSMGNKHLLTNGHYIDQLKQIQSRILQPECGILPEVKKLSTQNKNMSNSESDLTLLSTNNLPPKKTLTKLQNIPTNNNNIISFMNKDGNVTGGGDVSLQVVNAFPKKIQPESKQPTSNDLGTPSMEKLISNSLVHIHANSNGFEKMVPQIQPSLNGTLIHLRNRATTPHKAITNIGFKMDHKPLSTESNNQKTIPYTKGLRAGGGVLRITPKVDKQNYQFQFTSNFLNKLINESNPNIPIIESVIPYVEPGTENSYYTITSFDPKNSKSNQNNPNKSNNTTASSTTDINVISEKDKVSNKQRILALYQRIKESELDNSIRLNKAMSEEKFDNQTFEEKKRPRSRGEIRELTNLQVQDKKSKNPIIDQPSLTNFITSSNLIANTLRNTNNNKQIGKIKNLSKHLQMQHQEFFDVNPNEMTLKEKIISKKQQTDLVETVKVKDSDKKFDLTENKKTEKRLAQHDTILTDEEKSSTKRNINSPSFLNVINHRIKFQIAN